MWSSATAPARFISIKSCAEPLAGPSAAADSRNVGGKVFNCSPGVACPALYTVTRKLGREPTRSNGSAAAGSADFAAATTERPREDPAENPAKPILSELSFHS